MRQPGENVTPVEGRVPEQAAADRGVENNAAEV
jgi:hypothetical protein